MSDAALAERSTGDGIDILVDLSDIAAFFRLAAFAQQPAPYRLRGWIFEHDGMTRIQYRLCDRPPIRPA